MPAARTVRLRRTMTDEWTVAAEGKFVSEPDACYDDVFSGEPVDVEKPDGSLLFALRPRALPAIVATQAWDALWKAAKVTNNRPGAAGGAAKFRSGIVGFYERAPTAFTRTDRNGWWSLVALARELATVFRRERPTEYAKLEAAAEQAPGLLIDGTSFTTLTVNRNARTALHHDDGNLRGACGVLTAVPSGDYSGGRLVFPKYRAAVEIGACDVVIADNTELHGNTAIVGPGYRVTVVAYFNASNLPPGHPLR
jgi:hypothetical protein